MNGLRKCDIYIYIHTHTHTMQYYSAIKEKEIMLFAGKWMEMENIMLSEISQAPKVICYTSYVEDRPIK
jgi:hypothetical protein